MTYRTIGMIAAMPEEIKPFLRLASAYGREKINGFDAWRFNAGPREIHLVRSDMGPENAAAAARSLIAAARPELIINFGFAGGVTRGTGVGDVVVADRILLFRERIFSEQPGIAVEKTDALAGVLARADRTACGWKPVNTSNRLLYERDNLPRRYPDFHL